MICLHNHDQILEFLRKILLKGFQIYQRNFRRRKKRENNFEQNSENLIKIWLKNKEVMTARSFTNFHKTILDQSI